MSLGKVSVLEFMQRFRTVGKCPPHIPLLLYERVQSHCGKETHQHQAQDEPKSSKVRHDKWLFSRRANSLGSLTMLVVWGD
mmetsp:Transcript_25967/g.71517  ORF Transcript_25967/g.71517 Transcript_25967/m.71517 type:complete len:81 (+) Transcript_25967:296-538(+)